MTEVSVSSLDSPTQRLVEKARVALAREDWDYVAAVCEQVLKTVPGCVPVRRLQRDALLRLYSPSGRRWQWVRANLRLGAARLVFRNDPTAQLRVAERVLLADPRSPLGLRLLAKAATALRLPETAVFAWESLQEVQPTEPTALLSLARAYLAAGRPQEAAATAERVLRRRPGDAAAIELVRAAAVAEAVAQGQWTGPGDFRRNLRHPENDQPAPLR